MPLQDQSLRHGVAIVVEVDEAEAEAEADKYYMWTWAHDCSYELLGDLGRRGLGHGRGHRHRHPPRPPQSWAGRERRSRR